MKWHAFCVALSSSLVLFTHVAKAACSDLVGDANLVSSKAQDVQSYEASGDENQAKSAWNSMNHYALVGAQAFKSCDDTEPRLSYAVSFADATAVGMHYGLIPWSEGANDIGGSLQIIDSLPHSPTVKNEWDLVDRLYLQTCSTHNASCERRTY
ncbi:MAG TPA: hypothetical protein VEJ41_02115 [Candidatus Acidoferrales bacterium]|nr:hypothetical protein [Candidatus Acidoferrales bacterium]